MDQPRPEPKHHQQNRNICQHLYRSEVHSNKFTDADIHRHKRICTHSAETHPSYATTDETCSEKRDATPKQYVALSFYRWYVHCNNPSRCRFALNPFNYRLLETHPIDYNVLKCSQNVRR